MKRKSDERQHSSRLVAGSRQDDWSVILVRLAEESPVIAEAVAMDLGPRASAVEVEPLVRRFLALVARGPGLATSAVAALRAEAVAAARAGRPLAESIDAYLSTAWVAWERAIAEPGPGKASAPHLAKLGSALLRAGDDIAAALADGYTQAERSLAAQAGATRRAVLDEILALAPPSAERQSRLSRRAALVGLDPSASYGLLVIRAAAEIDDEGLGVTDLSRRLARDPGRRPHLVSTRDGDLVALVGGPWRGSDPLARALEGFMADDPWWAASTAPDGLGTLSAHLVEALDALRVLPACAEPRRAIPVQEVALERALVADPVLAAAAVQRWLGPIGSAGRGAGELLPTLEAWLEAGQSVTAAAAALRVAPRTVSYRLARIAHALGQPSLDAAVRERLSSALLVHRLLAAWRTTPPLSEDGGGPARSTPQRPGRPG